MKKNRALHESELKEKIANSLKLPKDCICGSTIATITGNKEIWIENYKGILEYTTEQVLIQSKSCRILIEGKCLCIDYYTNEDMKITGIIHCIRYF